MHHSKTKSDAIKLRKQGYSLSEISEKLSIAQSTSSIWLRSVTISELGKKRILDQQNIIKAEIQNRFLLKRENKSKELLQRINSSLSKVSWDKNLYKILCSFLYWGEGSKTGNNVSFINSDPEMIITFLSLLRKGFDIDEAKLRALIHIHHYHDEEKLLNFWSKKTGIPESRFNKSFKKQSTGLYKKTEYKGCLRIRYYDVEIARELQGLYNTVATIIKGL